MESALSAAQSKIPIPTDCTILEKKRLSPPELRVIIIQAFDMSEAEIQAQKHTSKTIVLKNLKLIATGKKGILGMGKTPNRYEAELLQIAVAEVTYKRKAKISITVLPKEQCSSIYEQFIQLENDEQTQNAVRDAIMERAARAGGNPYANIANALVRSRTSGNYDQAVFDYAVRRLATKYGLSEGQVRKIVESGKAGAKKQVR